MHVLLHTQVQHFACAASLQLSREGTVRSSVLSSPRLSFTHAEGAVESPAPTGSCNDSPGVSQIGTGAAGGGGARLPL